LTAFDTGAPDSCDPDCGWSGPTESEHAESVLIAAAAANPTANVRTAVMRTCSLSQHAL
jgi:hypothetical protein